MKLYAYGRDPIDFWPGWMTEPHFKASLSDRYHMDSDVLEAISRYEAFKTSAMELAKKAGWEGDIREGPYIAGLPTHDTADDRHIMIAWKQDNNGHTFIVSPYPLRWLEETGSRPVIGQYR